MRKTREFADPRSNSPTRGRADRGLPAAAVRGVRSVRLRPAVGTDKFSIKGDLTPYSAKERHDRIRRRRARLENAVQAADRERDAAADRAGNDARQSGAECRAVQLFQRDRLRPGNAHVLGRRQGPVSYTHLTLPTILRV